MKAALGFLFDFDAVDLVAMPLFEPPFPGLQQ
jgi:hypothetical protein